MSRVLVIGCGGVANVAIRKCCMVSEVFTELCIASRTKAKCDALAESLKGKTATKITTAQVDADNVQEVINLINSYKPDLVMNIALPYQDLTIMDACLACGVNYMDTANYEPEHTDDPEWRAIYEKRCEEVGFSAYFDYSWQWAYREKFEKAGLTALLGCGFDPGVTQAYCAYAKKHEFDTIDTIDILDCNGGDHGYPFATNFNPEINLREVSAPGSFWENGHWVEIPAMSIKREYSFDCVGHKDMYLLHHEEIESLALNIPEVKRIRFFMTFGQSYFERAGFDLRISEKSYQELGIDLTPTKHMGKDATALERKGVTTERGEENRAIAARNAQRLKELFGDTLVTAAELVSRQVHELSFAANRQLTESQYVQTELFADPQQRDVPDQRQQLDHSQELPPGMESKRRTYTPSSGVVRQGMLLLLLFVLLL